MAPKGRLISHFEDRQVTDHGQGWSNLWDTGDSDLWDRGKPSPALIDLVEAHCHEDTFNPSRSPTVGDGRKKALVPGCGRGYDVVSLALHGFDALGLEISATAVEEANEYARRELEEPTEYNFGPGYTRPLSSSGMKPGAVKILEGDFFASEWTDEKFDLVYDYTFLCALHPSQRGEWAARMAGLVRPGGVLVCLEFPMYKDPELPGPPWGVNGVHLEMLGGMFKRVLYEQPERTYEVGKGTDMISVYQRM